MNDKERAAGVNVAYFTPFLRSLNEGTFKTHLYPEIEFMMKRNASLVPVIGVTVSQLQFPFSPDFVHLVTSNIFTDEYMTKEDIIDSLKTYFHDLALKLVTPEALRTLISDFLLKRFIQTRNTSFNANQRMAFVRAISSALQAVKKREYIDQEGVKQVLTAVIDFFYMQKEDTHLKESYADFLKLFEFSD